MPATPTEPTLDAVPRLGEGCTHDAFGGGTIGEGGGAGNVGFVLQALKQLIIGAADVPAQNVAAGGLVPRKVAWGGSRARRV